MYLSDRPGRSPSFQDPGTPYLDSLVPVDSLVQVFRTQVPLIWTRWYPWIHESYIDSTLPSELIGIDPQRCLLIHISDQY